MSKFHVSRLLRAFLLFGALIVLCALCTSCRGGGSASTTARTTTKSPVYTSAPVTTAPPVVPGQQLTIRYTAHVNDAGQKDYYIVTGYDGAGDTAVIPETYGGLSVLVIGDGAFADCAALAHLSLPSSIAVIGYRAFYGCASLTGLALPGGVQMIDERAFENCRSLTDMTVPKSVRIIGFGAFSGCTSLENITLPFVGGSRTVTEGILDSYAAITAPLLSDSLASPCFFGYIFGGMEYNASLPTPDDSVFQGQERSVGVNHVTLTYRYYYNVPASLRTVTITDAEKLSECAFRGCGDLTSITLPETLTSIGASAFRGCTALSSLTLGNSAGWEANGVEVPAATLSDPAAAATALTQTYADPLLSKK